MVSSWSQHNCSFLRLTSAFQAVRRHKSDKEKVASGKQNFSKPAEPISTYIPLVRILSHSHVWILSYSLLYKGGREAEFCLFVFFTVRCIAIYNKTKVLLLENKKGDWLLCRQAPDIVCCSPWDHWMWVLHLSSLHLSLYATMLLSHETCTEPAQLYWYRLFFS